MHHRVYFKTHLKTLSLICSSKGKASLEILETQSWLNSSNKADFVERVTSAVSLIRVKHVASNCFSKLEGEKNPRNIFIWLRIEINTSQNFLRAKVA